MCAGKRLPSFFPPFPTYASPSADPSTQVRFKISSWLMFKLGVAKERKWGGREPNKP